MRLKLLVSAAVVLLLCGGYTAWWFHAAGLVAGRIEAWAAEERANAGLVEYGDLDVGGFPLRLSAGTSGIRIRRPDGLEWQGSRVVASAAPWDLSRIALTLGGEQHVLLPSGPRLVAQGGEGVIGTEGGRATSARLSLDDVALSPGPEPGAPARDRTVLADRLTVTAHEPAPGSQASLAGSLALDGVTLPDEPAPPLGTAIDRAAVELRLLGPLPADLAPSALAGWSAAGGRLAVDRLAVDWGPLNVGAEGTLALDPQLRPQGVLKAEAVGVAATLDALAERGVLQADAVDAAGTVLQLLARRRTPGGEPVVEVSVSLQDGWLYLGPIRVAQLPPLDAPAGPRPTPASPR